jgi:ParB/RepB/Spo0J family partition protein
MGIELVDGSECIVWRYHERLGEEISEASCSDLIESFRLHGQRHPALGRRNPRVGEPSIELIYGARRLFAAIRLKVKLIIDVREIEDRAAIKEMEIENRDRKDISAYERGMSYRRWLNAGLFSSQAELASQIGVSESQVSRLLKYGEIPAVVIGAFDSVNSIREDWAVALAKQCKVPDRRQVILRRAREAAALRGSCAPDLIFRKLIAKENSTHPEQAPQHDEVVRTSSGVPLYRVGFRSNTVHFIVPRSSLSEQDIRELKTHLAARLEQLVAEPASGPVNQPKIYPGRPLSTSLSQASVGSIPT